MSFQSNEHQLRDAIEAVEQRLTHPGTGRFGAINYCDVCGNNVAQYGHLSTCAWLIVKAYARRGDAR